MYRQKVFLLILSFMMLVALGGCNFPNTNESYIMMLFWDDFQDGDLSDPPPFWYGGTGAYCIHEYPFTRTEDSLAGGLSNSLGDPAENLVFTLQANQNHPCGHHYSGMAHPVTYDLGGFKPNHVSFRVALVCSGPRDAGYFVLSYDPHPNAPTHNYILDGIVFHFDLENSIGNPQTYGSLNVNGGLWGTYHWHYGYYYEDYSWYQIEFTNIDWDAQPNPTFTLIIDDQVMSDCIPFLNPMPNFEWLNVYSYNPATIIYDDILMEYNDMLELPDCSQLPPPPPPPPPSPALPILSPSPSLPITRPPTVTSTSTVTVEPPARLTAVTTANCRSGPGTGYPVINHLLEGHEAPVVGRSANSAWWQIQPEEGIELCWISNDVVEAEFNAEMVPIVAAPPTPTTTITSTQETAQEQGCTMKVKEGIECVVPCPEGAQPGNPCTP